MSIFSLGIQLGQGKASAAVRCAGRQSGRSTTTATTESLAMPPEIDAPDKRVATQADSCH
ncbi:MAG: hypothetical protein ABSH48_15630 [Verrucomicrobiota bacterium]